MSRPPATSPAPGEPHRNLSSLAAAMGQSIPTLSSWKARFPDCPSASLLESDWREFAAKHGLGHGPGRKTNKNRELLTNEKLASEIRLNEIKISKEERKLIPADDVETFLLHASSKAKSALYQLISETAPKLAGLEVGEIRRLLREAGDVYCLSMQTVVESWQDEQRAAREAAAHAAQIVPEDPE